MPPRARRQPSGQKPFSAQKPLSFNNTSRISKPTPATSTSKPLSLDNTKPLSLDNTKPSTDALASPPLKPLVPSAEKTEQEKAALRITDQEIKKYWKGCESERIAKRVHQADLSIEEKILRLWDMSSQYGPAIGITRQRRFARASRLKLNPPLVVLAVLLKAEGGAKTQTSNRAYVDELMNSKVGGDA